MFILSFLISSGCDRGGKPSGEIVSVKGAYVNWVKKVENAKGITGGVTNLYAEDAVLFPTLSSETCIGIKKIEQYFKYFLQLKDLKIETNELITRVYGDIAMNAGKCLISYTKGDQREVINVRFNFLYKKIEGEWKIVFHQSCRGLKDN